MTPDIKVSDQQIAFLLEGLLCSADRDLLSADSEVARDCFSRVAISTFSEPGDRLAGALVSALGAANLLSLVISRADDHTLRATLNDEATNSAEVIEESFNGNLGGLWNQLLDRWIPRVEFEKVRKNLENFKNLNGKLIWPDSQHFPTNLNVLGWAMPHLLWLRGNPEVLSAERTVAIVGSRTATNYGAQVTAELVSAVAERQVTTVSGGAFGIDTLVHKASIQCDTRTIAIMAGGLDSFYPRSNEQLFSEILESDAIISEVALGVVPAKFRFLQRNRLIAALGDATVVVEAGFRSGSINTANTAIELERPVGVVPGSVLGSTSVGCHRLAREHPYEVQLVTSGNDLLQLLNLSATNFELLEPLGVLETRALDAFAQRPLAFADVQRIAGLTTLETQLALGRLELLGQLVRHPSGFVRAGNNLEM